MIVGSSGLYIESLRTYIGLDGLYIGDNIHVPLWVLIIASIVLFIVFLNIIAHWFFRRERKYYKDMGYEHVLCRVLLFSSVGNMATLVPITMVVTEKCIGFIDKYAVESKKSIEVPLNMIDEILILTADEVTGPLGTAGFGERYHAGVFDRAVPRSLRGPQLKRNGEMTKPDMSHLYIVVNYNELGRKKFGGIGILVSTISEQKIHTQAYVANVEKKLEAFPNRKRNDVNDKIQYGY